jgi:hypothetical protein
MEAIGELTGGIAHDFNNMLTGITDSLELLKVRVAQGRIGDLDRFITAAHGAALRAGSLTRRGSACGQTNRRSGEELGVCCSALITPRR